MAKYKLTVKYSGVCELTLESTKRDVVSKEFDRYVKSFLETNIVPSYGGDFSKIMQDAKMGIEPVKEIKIVDGGIVIPSEETEAEEKHNISDEKIDGVDYSIEENVQKNIEDCAPDDPPPTRNRLLEMKLSEKIYRGDTEAAQDIDYKPNLQEYSKNKNVSNALDEFVLGACYMDEILGIKEFTLKQINSNLYPVFHRLADLEIIETAKRRVLIDIKEINGTKVYSINQNAWNYHNYDLVRQ